MMSAAILIPNLYRILFIFALLTIYACEDVIDVDIIQTDDLIVVDAWITDEPVQQVISIHFSQSYFDNSQPRPVLDAFVSIERDDGGFFTFSSADNGEYIWHSPDGKGLGKVGQSFRLSIERDGTTYTAESTLHRVPPIDSIGQEYRENELLGGDGTYAQFYSRDFPGKGDAYWIKAFKNGVYLDKSQEINIAYDAGFDAGTGIDGIIFIPPIRELINPLDEDLLVDPYVPGDSLRVEIHSLSVFAFNFLEIARDQINNSDNGIFTLPLANTNSNITSSRAGETTLGFFHIAAVSSLETIIE